MKVLWQVPDGREFVITGKDMDEIQEKITEKRKELGLPMPQMMLAKTNNPELLKSKTPVLSLEKDFNEEDQEKIKEAINQTEQNINNRKLN